MRSQSGVNSFSPVELRKLRALKTPAGVQRFLDSLPYHLADTAWSPQKVLQEKTAHCLEGAIFAAAALRVLGVPPLLGGSGKIQLRWMPLSRAGLSHLARAGHELFQHLLQSSR